MIYLFDIGFSEEDIKELLEINPELSSLSYEEIVDIVEVLKDINCDDKIIKNIIMSNPLYLNRCTGDVKALINKLESLGIQRLDITFDSNPWLLNKDAFEIDDYIEEEKRLGKDLEEIIDAIDMGFID